MRGFPQQSVPMGLEHGREVPSAGREGVGPMRERPCRERDALARKKEGQAGGREPLAGDCGCPAPSPEALARGGALLSGRHRCLRSRTRWARAPARTRSPAARGPHFLARPPSSGARSPTAEAPAPGVGGLTWSGGCSPALRNCVSASPRLRPRVVVVGGWEEARWRTAALAARSVHHISALAFMGFRSRAEDDEGCGTLSTYILPTFPTTGQPMLLQTRGRNRW
jgi:hypothetical protein